MVVEFAMVFPPRVELSGSESVFAQDLEAAQKEPKSDGLQPTSDGLQLLHSKHTE